MADFHPIVERELFDWNPFKVEPPPPRDQRKPIKKCPCRVKFLGEEHGRAKLTEAIVLTIRAAAADGVGHRELAKRYDVSPSRISAVVRRKAWTHI